MMARSILLLFAALVAAFPTAVAAEPLQLHNRHDGDHSTPTSTSTDVLQHTETSGTGAAHDGEHTVSLTSTVVNAPHHTDIPSSGTSHGHDSHLTSSSSTGTGAPHHTDAPSGTGNAQSCEGVNNATMACKNGTAVPGMGVRGLERSGWAWVGTVVGIGGPLAYFL